MNNFHQDQQPKIYTAQLITLPASVKMIRHTQNCLAKQIKTIISTKTQCKIITVSVEQ